MARPDVGTFLESFVLPLVAGGEIRVGAPLSIDDVNAFEQALGHASPQQVAVDDARALVLSTVVCRPPSLVLDGDELALAAGLHNALFLVHPDADGWSVTDSQRRRIVLTAQRLVSQPLSRHRTRVLARHALLHHVFDLSRTDTYVSWWTGRARFLGQKAPSRLTAWRGVRRVREEVQRVAYDELLAAPDIAPLVAALLRRTPLTQLLRSHPAAPALHWEDAVFLLRDVELARAISYEAIRPGEPRDQIAVPARLAAAFEQMLERSPAEADVRAVAGFLVYLSGLLALAEARMREPAARSPLLSAVLAVERAGQRPRGLATFFALPMALAQVDPRLSVPPGVGSDPALARRWSVHRAQAAEAVGEAVIETLAARLRRHLKGALPPPAAERSEDVLR
jgi:hypothetical protein